MIYWSEWDPSEKSLYTKLIFNVETLCCSPFLQQKKMIIVKTVESPTSSPSMSAKDAAYRISFCTLEGLLLLRHCVWALLSCYNHKWALKYRHSFYLMCFVLRLCAIPQQQLFFHQRWSQFKWHVLFKINQLLFRLFSITFNLSDISNL